MGAWMDFPGHPDLSGSLTRVWFSFLSQVLSVAQHLSGVRCAQLAKRGCPCPLPSFDIMTDVMQRDAGTSGRECGVPLGFVFLNEGFV